MHVSYLLCELWIWHTLRMALFKCGIINVWLYLLPSYVLQNHCIDAPCPLPSNLLTQSQPPYIALGL